MGLGKDPEQYYFESLYRQSEGIFRSAFELWLQSVDRIEGGVLYMLSPSEPDYGKMLSQLTLEDVFKLQAILQHGSLTVEESAQIFDESYEKSNRCIDKLIAWDVLEKDPACPGFRVNPNLLVDESTMQPASGDKRVAARGNKGSCLKCPPLR